MSEEIKEYLPKLIETLKELKERNEFSGFGWHTDLDVNEEDGIVMK